MYSVVFQYSRIWCDLTGIFYLSILCASMFKTSLVIFLMIRKCDGRRIQINIDLGEGNKLMTHEGKRFTREFSV